MFGKQIGLLAFVQPEMKARGYVCFFKYMHIFSHCHTANWMIVGCFCNIALATRSGQTLP